MELYARRSRSRSADKKINVKEYTEKVLSKGSIEGEIAGQRFKGSGPIAWATLGVIVFLIYAKFIHKHTGGKVVGNIRRRISSRKTKKK